MYVIAEWRARLPGELVLFPGAQLEFTRGMGMRLHGNEFSLVPRFPYSRLLIKDFSQCSIKPGIWMQNLASTVLVSYYFNLSSVILKDYHV